MCRVWKVEMCKGKIERSEISTKFFFFILVVVRGAGALLELF